MSWARSALSDVGEKREVGIEQLHIVVGIIGDVNESDFVNGDRLGSHEVGEPDSQGTELIRFYERSRELDFTNFEFDEATSYSVDYRKFAAGPDGRLYVANQRDHYAITVYNPDGTVDRVSEREYDALFDRIFLYQYFEDDVWELRTK